MTRTALKRAATTPATPWARRRRSRLSRCIRSRWKACACCSRGLDACTHCPRRPRIARPASRQSRCRRRALWTLLMRSVSSTRASSSDPRRDRHSRRGCWPLHAYPPLPPPRSMRAAAAFVQICVACALALVDTDCAHDLDTTSDSSRPGTMANVYLFFFQ
eukprot:IDg17088t1